MAQQHQRRMAIGAGISLGAIMTTGASAEAASFEVDNLGDPAGAGACTAAAGDCSLRQAVVAANAAGTDDQVNFQSGLTGQITLNPASGGEIPITDHLYINGPGADRLTISGNNSSRIFNVDPVTAGEQVSIYNLTLTAGAAPLGGAIRDEDARLTVARCVLTLNTSGGDGGAIFEQGGFSNGESTFVMLSTISGNTAGDDGGGIYGFLSAGGVYNSTISGNHVTAGANHRGAGIYSYFPFALGDSTVSGNGPASEAGGIGMNNPGTDISGSIVANNTATTAGTADVFGPADARFSLIEDPGTAAINPTVPGSLITGVDPQLGPLQVNGGNGQTLTHRPAATSPVVDKGNSGPFTDQRGMPRVVDNPNAPNSTATGATGSDMGAVELSLAEGPQAPLMLPATPPVAPPAKAKKCKKAKKKGSARVAKKCKKKRK